MKDILTVMKFSPTRHLLWVLCLAATCVFAASSRLQPLNEADYYKALSKFKGQVVLVDFWATWCSPCLEELPQLAQLAKELSPKGFRLLTVSCDEPEDLARAQEVLAKNQVPGPWFYKRTDDDEKFINTVDKTWSGALPALFLYDKNGHLIKRFIGETPVQQVRQAIVEALR